MVEQHRHRFKRRCEQPGYRSDQPNPRRRRYPPGSRFSVCPRVPIVPVELTGRAVFVNVFFALSPLAFRVGQHFLELPLFVAPPEGPVFLERRYVLLLVYRSARFFHYFLRVCADPYRIFVFCTFLVVSDQDESTFRTQRFRNSIGIPSAASP